MGGGQRATDRGNAPDAAFAASPTPKEARVLQQHSAYLKDLMERGVLLLAGRTLNNDEATFGIAIIKFVIGRVRPAIRASGPSF
jgi:hypothetical protein